MAGSFGTTMARIHARRKGKSGSKRPLVTSNPAWVTVERDEIEDRIVKLHAEGVSSAQIGLRLRDTYGVPSVRLATGKSLVQILRAKGAKFDIPEELGNLMKRAVQLQVHLKTNPKDLANKRGLHLVESKIRRLSRYFKREGLLPPDWDYSLKLAELFVK